MFFFKRTEAITDNFIAELMYRFLGHVTHDEKLKTIYLQQIEQEVKQLKCANLSVQQAKQCYLDARIPLTKEIENQLRNLQLDDNLKINLLKAGWRIIWSDKYLGLREYQSIHLCGYWLGLDREMINALGDNYRPKYIASEYQQAMILLGITEHTSLDMVKKAYKHLLGQHHPDKVMGEGGDTNKVYEATVLTIEINKAYELIQTLHDADK